MKLRMLGIAAVLVLAPGLLQAQIVRRGPTKGVQTAAETVHLYLKAKTINNMIPVLQAAGYSSEDTSFTAKLAARGMTKQEYVANKNALMIARQDDLDPRRLTAIKDPGALQARQANAGLYHADKLRLDPVLSKLEPEPGCALCSGPTVPVKNR